MRWLDGITEPMEFEQTLGDGGGQGSLACCSPWGHKQSDTTERLKNKQAAKQCSDPIIWVDLFDSSNSPAREILFPYF